MGQSSLITHNFHEDLKWSELPKQYIAYMRAIVHWWPDIDSWDRITDLMQQKKGKDITLQMNGAEIRLQFKSRRNDYGDCLIEYRHDYNTGFSTPGWIEKKEEIDFLIYCVPKKIYKIEWKSLKAAWEMSKEYWLAFHDLPPANNGNYETRNVAIRWEVLKEARVLIDEFYL